MNCPVNATVSYRDQSIDLVLNPGDTIGRAQICPSSQTLSRNVFRVEASYSKKYPHSVDVSIVHRYCRFEMLLCNGQKGAVIEVGETPRTFIYFMRRRDLGKYADLCGFRIVEVGRPEKDATGEEKVMWKTLSEGECIQVIFNSVQSAVKADKVDNMVVDTPVLDEPAPALPLRLGKKPLLWAKWQKVFAERRAERQAKLPQLARAITQWRLLRRKFRMAVLQDLRDKMRRGEWFPSGKHAQVEESDDEEKGADVSEEALPALENEMVGSRSDRHMNTLIRRALNADQRVGVIPKAAVLCAVNCAFNVEGAYRNLPMPSKKWDSQVGIDRANKTILSAISDVKETMCHLKVLKRSSLEKGRPSTADDIQHARSHVEECRRYIDEKFKKTFGAKVIREGIRCFIRRDGIKTPPSDFKLHFCVEGTVVGVDPATRATIIAVGDAREQYYLPDERVHFNRSDAEMGTLKRR